MKNFIKDIMKLDLSKFSKPRSSSTGQQRLPKHQNQAQQLHMSDQQQVPQQAKKRKVLPSPAAHNQVESRTAPTAFSAATNSSQTSIQNINRLNEQVLQKYQNPSKISNVEKIMKVQARTNNTGAGDTSASPQPLPVPKQYEYASQPKYLNYGMLTVKQRNGNRVSSLRSNEQNVASTSPSKTCNTSESRVNLSGANFILPSNRTTNRNAKDHMGSAGANTDIYGV